ncbi:MAG: phage tail sheath C-terminal domain-containing protein [Hydrogenoanaerobacterium sp.]
MGLPNINIEFKTAGTAAIKRSQKGTVGLIIKDANAAAKGTHILTKAAEAPPELGDNNKKYIEQAFMGYINPPRMVIIYVLAADAANLNEALNFFALTAVDYLAGPADCTAKESADIASWVKTQRTNNYTPKAVLPNQKADSDGIINFTASEIKTGEKTPYTTAQYCARIAGLIAGTPMNIACTYAPLPEVTDIKKLTKAELDKAQDVGEFVLYHDGIKVKAGRGINSLTTTTQDKGEPFKKIKIVEAVDMIRTDITRTAQDSFIGKYANSYDNKCLLITAISGYFLQLELDGILSRGKSTVGIDTAAQEAYLKSHGTDTSKMTAQEIKEAETGAEVFLMAKISILDAIEDISISIIL